MQLTQSWRLLPLVAPLFFSTIANAQSAEPSVTGKGLVGGALLGSEVIVLTEAAFKVKPGWAYYLGGGVGLIGGGIAGHYLESSLSPKGAMYMLSAGMLLVIPSAVAAMNAASYDTPLEYTQDAPPTDQPSDDSFSSGTIGAQANPGGETPTMPAMSPQQAPPPVVAPEAPPTTTPPAPPTTSPAPAQPQGVRQQHRSQAIAHWRSAPVFVPPALLDLSGKELALAVPAVEVRETYSRREVAMYGVKQQTEVRVPLFQMVF